MDINEKIENKFNQCLEKYKELLDIFYTTLKTNHYLSDEAKEEALYIFDALMEETDNHIKCAKEVDKITKNAIDQLNHLSCRSDNMH